MSRYSDAKGRAKPRLTEAKVLAAADAKFGKGLGGMLSADGSDRRAFYNKYAKVWVVEYNSDPAIYYRAYMNDDGTIEFVSEMLDLT